MSRDLDDTLVFVKVVEHGSFISAARALRLPKTTVSRKVQDLETRLGAQLLHRTTRKLGLTEAGNIYFEHSQRIARELEEAARVEGCSWMGVLWLVYVPLARPTYLAYALVSVSYHWNNFLWPLVVTNSVNTRPLTVGLAIFGAPESGVDWSVISAGTLIAVAPLLVAFLLFQRQFMQSFMQAGIK